MGTELERSRAIRLDIKRKRKKERSAVHRSRTYSPDRFWYGSRQNLESPDVSKRSPGHTAGPAGSGSEKNADEWEYRHEGNSLQGRGLCANSLHNPEEGCATAEVILDADGDTRRRCLRGDNHRKCRIARQLNGDKMPSSFRRARQKCGSMAVMEIGYGNPFPSPIGRRL